MTEKFKNKYRIESARMQNWDYGWSSSYFITICTANREYFFGDVLNGKMILSEIGKLVESEWLKTIDLRPDMNLELDEYMVMPNHFHAIIFIGKNEYNSKIKNDNNNVRDTMHCVSTTNPMHCVSTTDPMHCGSTEKQSNKNPQPKNQFGPQSKNLASIIRGFKSAVTINARKINPDFAWQSKFHDHVVRDYPSLQRIRKYIINNPKNWKEDSFKNS
jgi:putative transposase